MSTVECLTSKRLRLKRNYEFNNKVVEKILGFIEYDNENSNISFLRISDDIVNKVAEANACNFPDGFDKYLIVIDENVHIYYSTDISMLYAACEIRKKYEFDGIACGFIYGRAIAPFRGYKSYLPPKEKIGEYKEFIDLMVSLGYNKLMLELGGACEYKSHPEINSGWEEFCEIFKEYNGKTMDAQRMYIYPKNSLHVENGGGSYLTETELKEIVDYCSERFIEIIPEMPSLSHSDYILYNHPELAENKNDILPDIACPSNEDYYKLLFELFDDVIRIFKPKRINVGHDELYVLGFCDKCKNKSAEKLLEDDLTKIHDYLKSKGVATMLWGDKIAKTWHGGSAAFHMRTETDRKITYKGQTRRVGKFKCHSVSEFLEYVQENHFFQGWYVSETYKCSNRLPKDLQIANWSWGRGEEVEDKYSEQGYYSVFGNWSPLELKDLQRRCSKDNIEGVFISNWGNVDRMSMQRGGIYFNLFAGSDVLWNEKFDYSDKKKNITAIVKKIFEFMNHDLLKSKYIELLHYCDFEIKHESFDCGYRIIREDYHIGDYFIEYDDGSTDIYSIIWGENIGCNYVADGSRDDTGNEPHLNVVEQAGTSLPVFEDNGTVKYKILIPLKKNIKNLTLIKNEKCIGEIKYTI